MCVYGWAPTTYWNIQHTTLIHIELSFFISLTLLSMMVIKLRQRYDDIKLWNNTYIASHLNHTPFDCLFDSLASTAQPSVVCIVRVFYEVIQHLLFFSAWWWHRERLTKLAGPWDEIQKFKFHVSKYHNESLDECVTLAGGKFRHNFNICLWSGLFNSWLHAVRARASLYTLLYIFRIILYISHIFFVRNNFFIQAHEEMCS